MIRSRIVNNKIKGHIKKNLAGNSGYITNIMSKVLPINAIM